MDLTFEVKVPNIPLFSAGAGPAIVQEELVAATEFGLMAAQGAIIPKTPVNQGLLRGAVQTQLTGDKTSVLGRVFNPLEYANPVEKGARAHWAPIGPLILWAQRKFSVDEKEAKGIAYAVRHKIAERGSEPRRMFEEGWAQVKGQVSMRFSVALARAIQRIKGGA